MRGVVTTPIDTHLSSSRIRPRTSLSACNSDFSRCLNRNMNSPEEGDGNNVMGQGGQGGEEGGRGEGREGMREGMKERRGREGMREGGIL